MHTSWYRHLELHARYALLAPILVGKSVLNIDCNDVLSASYLLKSGLTHLWLSAPEKKYLEKKGLIDARLMAYTMRSNLIEMQDATCDIIVCHHLAQRLSQEPYLLAEYRRILHPNGYLLTAVPNKHGHRLANMDPEAQYLDPNTLQAILNEMFAAVSIYKQIPFIGNMFATDSAPHDAQISIDPSLVSDRPEDPASWYIYIFGPKVIKISEQTIIQLSLEYGVSEDTFEQKILTPQKNNTLSSPDTITPHAQEKSFYSPNGMNINQELQELEDWIQRTEQPSFKK